MKTFKYKLKRWAYALIYAGLVLSGVAFGLNVYSVCTEKVMETANPTFGIIRYILLFAVSIALFIILISILTGVYYAIDDKYFRTSFGIIKSKFELKEIKSIILDRQTDKLTVQFKNENFIHVVINNDWYDEFIDALLKANPEIEYSINSKENSPDDKPQG